MFKITNLNVLIKNKELLNNINLEIKEQEVHAIMGPNGAGKSTLLKAIMSYPGLQKSIGKIEYENQDITNKLPNEIANLGIYYLAQNPMAIEGVTTSELIRTALQEKGKWKDIFTFNKECNKICEILEIPKDFIHREINVSMSGGEKKKQELLIMHFLEPKLIILDEIDSGLDVDAVKIVANFLKEYLKEHEDCSILLVSHQPLLLKYLEPTHVHLLINKTFIKNGDKKLKDEILENGFQKFNGTML